mgnify:CR=1 FL=1
MISEADAREAARHLAVCRERLSKLDKEDVEFKHVARDMDNHAWRLACFAVGELARRDWQDEPDSDGWYWCEDLPADSTPQLFRSYLPLKFNSEDSTYSVEMNAPRRYRRWTIAGWVEPTGRVCKITERPT